MFQIIFNEISAAEISSLPKEQQLELLSEFRVSPDELEQLENSERFGKLERKGKTLYRYRANEVRIYFEIGDEAVLVHRVLHKNTFQDFLFRTKMPVTEDEALSKSGGFWELIEEGERARPV